MKYFLPFILFCIGIINSFSQNNKYEGILFEKRMNIVRTDTFIVERLIRNRLIEEKYPDLTKEIISQESMLNLAQLKKGKLPAPFTFSMEKLNSYDMDFSFYQKEYDHYKEVGSKFEKEDKKRIDSLEEKVRLLTKKQNEAQKKSQTEIAQKYSIEIETTQQELKQLKAKQDIVRSIRIKN